MHRLADCRMLATAILERTGVRVSHGVTPAEPSAPLAPFDVPEPPSEEPVPDESDPEPLPDVPDPFVPPVVPDDVPEPLPEFDDESPPDPLPEAPAPAPDVDCPDPEDVPEPPSEEPVPDESDPEPFADEEPPDVPDVESEPADCPPSVGVAEASAVGVAEASSPEPGVDVEPASSRCDGSVEGVTDGALTQSRTTESVPCPLVASMITAADAATASRALAMVITMAVRRLLSASRPIRAPRAVVCAAPVPMATRRPSSLAASEDSTTRGDAALPAAGTGAESSVPDAVPGPEPSAASFISASEEEAPASPAAPAASETSVESAPDSSVSPEPAPDTVCWMRFVESRSTFW